MHHHRRCHSSSRVCAHSSLACLSTHTQRFKHYDANNNDDAKEARNKAKLVYDLLMNDKQLAEERSKAKKIYDVKNQGFGAGDSFSNDSYGQKYDDGGFGGNNGGGGRDVDYNAGNQFNDDDAHVFNEDGPTQGRRGSLDRENGADDENAGEKEEKKKVHACILIIMHA